MKKQGCLDVSTDDYELDFISLYYNKEDNVFVDDDGFIIWNIFNTISLNDLYLFHQVQEDMLVRHRTLPGVTCELCYPIEDRSYIEKDIRHVYI